MSFILKDTIHQSLVDSVYNEFLSRRANYYYYIGKVIDWVDTNTPDTPISTQDYEYQTRNDIITVKRLNLRDVSYVVPRRNWTSGTVYDYYDPNYSIDRPAHSGATSLKTSLFYVLTSSFGVYKCLYNNNNGASTIEPSGTDVTPVTYGDGYVWKYLYTIPLSSRNRFLTENYMPVQRAVENAFYSNGEISSIVIDNPGSGYFGNADVTLTVTGTFLGLPGNSIANLTPIFSDSGQFINVLIDAPGNNYKTATITIVDNQNSGNSYYKGVANVQITNVGVGYTTPARNNTTVILNTTGVFQPTSNAVLSPVYSANNNNLIAITVTNPGTGYTNAVRSNTSVVIATTGNTQPTTNATANVYFNEAAVLTPVLRNGKIDRVLINDPGTGYSANNRTTITTIGDGTGVVLQPVIDSNGQLADVIIASRGEGYTYLDINIVGPGANANAYAVLSTGDLNSVQSAVELSAVDGGIHSFNINDGGDGYTSASISVFGDGTGFVGNVIRTNNIISSITITNPGSGYRYANVVITGPGSNANIAAIISPENGHGSDAVKELFADTLILYSTINNEKNHGVTVNNDYRQFGLIKNIRKFDSGQVYTETIGSSCYLVTLDNVTGLSSDNILTFIDGNNQSRIFQVVEVISSTNQVLLNGKNGYELDAEDVLYSELLASYTVISIDEVPNINKFSGELLYIDNRTTVSYSDQQLVTLRTIIQL